MGHSGRISRQRMVRMLGVGAGVALAPLSMTAHAAQELQDSAAASVGGTPVLNLEGEPNSLQPFMSSSRITFTVLDQINANLVRYDKNLKLMPRLATSWDFLENGKAVRFHLRKGIMFHNGQEMTADDVKFSIEAHLNPAQGSSIRSQLAPLDHVEVVDKYTVVIHLKTPYAPLLDILANSFAPILPRSVYARPGSAKDQPVGCGPFRFKTWVKNSYILLERNPHYWEPGYPKSDGLKFVFLADYNSAKASLLSREIDVLLQVQPADVPDMKQQSGLVVSGVLVLGFEWIGMNCTRPPFNNKNLRQAVKYAVNRTQWLAEALANQGATAVIPIPPNSPYYSPVPTSEYAQDLAKAKKLLAQAGYAKGLSITISVPNTPEEKPMGIVLQSQLQAIGINAQIEDLEVPTFIEQVFTNQTFSIMIVGDTAGPDPAFLLNSYYLSTSSNNIQHYKNPQVDTLLMKAIAVTDITARRDLYRRALAIAVDDAPMVWMDQGLRTSAYWDYLAGFYALPTLQYDLWKLQIVKQR